MKNISELEILGKLDPLKENEDLGTHVDPISGKTIFRRSYYSDDLYIVTYASESSFAVDAIWEVYEVLNIGAGDYIKSFKKDENTVVISWPRYEDKFEDATYTLMIEEIIRVAAWQIKSFGKLAAEGYISDYISTCVSK